MKKYVVLLFALFLLSISCGGGRASVIEKKVAVNKEVKNISEKEDIRFNIKCNISYRQGDEIVIYCDIKETVDSINLFLGNKKVNSKFENGRWIVKTDDKTKVGATQIKVVVSKGGINFIRVANTTIYTGKEAKHYKARALKTYQRNRNIFTQGLEFYNGMLYESSGEYGKSYVHILDFPSMKVKAHTNLDAKYFAEGITILNDKMYLLTWLEKKCFVFDAKTLKQIAEFQYNTEGWGITNDGKYLYMTDGSQYIYVLDPETFKQVDRLEVMLGDKPLKELNELEWIEGEIWANIFTLDTIVRINPLTGAVVGIVDASDLLLRKDYNSNTDVLNGIAYDKVTKKIYLTGKNWPKLFEVVVRNE